MRADPSGVVRGTVGDEVVSFRSPASGRVERYAPLRTVSPACAIPFLLPAVGLMYMYVMTGDNDSCPVIAHRLEEPRLLLSFHPVPTHPFCCTPVHCHRHAVMKLLTTTTSSPLCQMRHEDPCTNRGIFSHRWTEWVALSDDRLRYTHPSSRKIRHT